MRHKTKAQIDYQHSTILKRAEAIGLAVISRRDAEFAGLDRYFDGKLCPQRHISARSVVTGRCLACCSVKNRAAREKNGSYKTSRRQSKTDTVRFGRVIPLANTQK